MSNETSDADMLSEFEEAHNGGNYSYDTFEAWSAKVWDDLPRLLALAKDGLRWRRMEQNHEKLNTWDYADDGGFIIGNYLDDLFEGTDDTSQRADVGAEGGDDGE